MKLIAVVAWLLAGLALLLSFGCATTSLPPPRDGEAEASRIVWEAFGRTDEPPRIRWVRGQELDCTLEGGSPGFTVILRAEDGVPGVACRSGFTMSLHEVLVADHEEPFSDSSAPHEFLHVDLARRGIFDDLHQRPDWGPGGKLESAVAALKAAGL